MAAKSSPATLLRSLFHLQEDGTRAHLSDQRAEVSYKRPQRSESWRIAALQAKAEQIDRLQSSLAAVLTSEQAQLQDLPGIPVVRAKNPETTALGSCVRQVLQKRSGVTEGFFYSGSYSNDGNWSRRDRPPQAVGSSRASCQ